MSETHHGTRERVSWSVTETNLRVPHPSTSTRMFGERETEARDYYEVRAKYLHRGYRVELERTVTTEAWVQHRDALESKTKEVVA